MTIERGAGAKTALVTGGGGGIGRGISLALAAAGFVVAVNDLEGSAGADETVAEIVAAGHEAYVVRADVRRAADVTAMVDKVVERSGTLDVLVNNAGVDLTVPFDQLDAEDWDRILGVNLRGPFLMSREVFPLMRAAGRGHIVNIVSTAAKRAWANAAAYHASKWGLLGLSHALHVEGRPHGVKVTAVVAGGMRTPFLLERFPDLDPGVLQDPGHVAATVVFVLTQPAETVVPEVTVLPMRETSWP